MFAKDQLRLERVQNKFLTYAAYVLKLPDPCHEYNHLLNVLNIPSLHYRHHNAGQNFILALLNGLLEATDIFSNISFKVPLYNIRNQVQFCIPT